MTHLTRIAAAALLSAAIATPALAQDWLGPRVVGTGENGSVVYATPSQNIVGGATYSVSGSGESATVEVIAVEHALPGRLTRSVGSGESLEVIQLDAAQQLADTGRRG